MLSLKSHLILAALASVATSDDGSCPGGYADGATIVSGNYWYKCEKGTRVAGGCIDSNNNRVDVQGTFDVGDVRMQCVKGSDGYLTTLFKSCVVSGREYQVGEKWDDGKTGYTCAKDGNAVRPQPSGCVSNGRTVALGDTVADGDTVLKCQKSSSGQLEMGRGGCQKDGKEVKVGGTYESGQFWYTCTDKGGQVSGCVRDAHRFQDKDKYQDKSAAIVYECQVNGDKSNLVAAACIGLEDGVETEKKFDCYWNEGSAPEMYQMTCTYDAANNKAVKSQTACLYKLSQGTFTVKPGCLYSGGGIAVGCEKVGSGKLAVRTFSGEKPDEQAKSAGFQQC